MISSHHILSKTFLGFRCARTCLASVFKPRVSASSVLKYDVTSRHLDEVSSAETVLLISPRFAGFCSDFGGIERHSAAAFSFKSDSHLLVQATLFGHFDRDLVHAAPDRNGARPKRLGKLSRPLASTDQNAFGPPVHRARWSDRVDGQRCPLERFHLASRAHTGTNVAPGYSRYVTVDAALASA